MSQQEFGTGSFIEFWTTRGLDAPKRGDYKTVACPDGRVFVARVERVSPKGRKFLVLIGPPMRWSIDSEDESYSEHVRCRDLGREFDQLIKESRADVDCYLAWRAAVRER